MPTAMFTVGGAISGLSGNSIALRLNGGADLVVAANGSFTFPSTIASGTAYTVTIQTQPTGPSQTCVLVNATGSIAADVTNVTVSCATNTYRVRGALSGLAGGSVVLRNNGSDDLVLSGDGAFEFPTAVPSGGAYAITVETQPLAPSQNCVVGQGAGTVVAADITNIQVTCTANNFSIGGTVSGLSGSGLVLRNNGGNDLAVNANGAFTFMMPVTRGGSYRVSVLTQPTAPSQLCSVTNGDGSQLVANVTNVAITCISFRKVGGTVRGLDVGGLVLRNSGGDDLSVNTNGTFQFNTPILPGGTYNVTVAGTPSSPRHVCKVTNGSGTVGTNADVTNVQVTCEADRFAYVTHFSTSGFTGPGLITALVSNHETGALTSIAGTSTFVTAPGADSIVSDPRGRFIYIIAAGADPSRPAIFGYAVNPVTGALTSVPGSPFADGTVTASLAIDSEGRFLYGANFGSNNVSGWAIQADGSLTPVPGSPYALGDAALPRSLATTPAGRCCYLYVLRMVGASTQVSAFAYNQTTGALTPVPSSPFLAPQAASPSSIIVNNTGERVYLAAAGSQSISTFDLAAANGALTLNPLSPTTAGTPCQIRQPPLSKLLFSVSGQNSQVTLFGEDPNTSLPTFLDSEFLFTGNYCSIATDPYGHFIYLPNSGGASSISDYLFGFTVGTNGTTLEPLPLDTSSPINTYTLSAQQPNSMVLRYSRRDRELLQIPE